MALAFKQSGTLLAVNLFTTVAEAGGPAGPAEIAGKIGIPTEPTERLMIACASLGLLEKRGSQYVNAADVEKYLVKGSPTNFGDYLVWQIKGEYDGWKNIASLLRPPRGAYDMSDPQTARALTVAGYQSSISAGHKLAREFDFSPYSLWLDLGGGSGCYSIAAALRYPHLRTIVFDQANVVVVAEEFIAQAGLSDRVKTHGGHFFQDEFPRGADLISYIGCLQAYEADDVQFVINKAFDAVEPGGGIIFIDYMLNDDKTGPLDPVFRHLTGASRTNPARVNSGAEVCEYLRKAGFVDMEVNEFIPGQMGRVTAKKPK
jgi:SAM-dependent methyltransferase